MSWEESRRNEQVFRKTKLNREVILKTVEDEDGKINIILSLRDNEMSTELNLTTEEWESIIYFLNKTSERIIKEINEKLGRTTKESTMKPLTKFIKPSKTEDAQKYLGGPVKVPAAEVITEIKAEPVKVPAEEVITESEIESIEISAEEAITESEIESEEGSAEEAITESEIESMEGFAEEAITESEIESMEGFAEEAITEPVNEPSDISVNTTNIQTEIKLGQELEEPVEPPSISVANELFEELATEMQKVTPIQSIENPITDITPITQETESQSAAATAPEIEKKPDNSLDIKNILDLLNEIPEAKESNKELEPISEPTTNNERTTPPPIISKFPEPTKEQLKTLLTPIKQPKISSIEKFETEVPTSNKEAPIPSKIEAKELLKESVRPPPLSPPPKPGISKPIASQPPSPVAPSAPTPEIVNVPVTLGKDDEQLTSEEKEARIVSAMEEVAALMPPGPAKKFVEEMMLKRAEKSDLDKPRMPKLNNSDSTSEANSESTSDTDSDQDEKKSKWKFW